ncbi:phosphotransferase system, phosphocarrier protein HPr [Brachyspira hampsonii 30446]|uniref:Phosphotransferase system, phosphocarrier protein HPr n=3 Tax=Brachyspira hampsonii TaxID=1287055 RepID=A0A2U4ETX2_9SPIR|nr:HPr family phosphocarrier protein [Brachyspira hampsonii]EKV55986.1 phosphotransferase system, phosphocarrier protein HPr [Brachyspira hampsonii 30446]OEJ17938.1 phosphocarrier protein HPr [Brachyspira hampsonii]
MENNDFISKEFECRNDTLKDVKEIYPIVDYFKTIDDKIEIENQNGKRVNAKSFVRVSAVNIRYGDRFILYVYGDERENNIKNIEEFLCKNKFYTLEKIEELEKEKEKLRKEEEAEHNRYIEKEILSLTPDDKKEIVKINIEEKIKLLKEKRDSLHLESLNSDNNILYIKDNDKTKIIDIINNNICDIIKHLSSHYEISIKESRKKNFISYLISVVKGKDMKFFDIYMFFNDIKKYLSDQFYKLFIEKIIGIEDLHEEYDTIVINNFVEESIKTLDYVIEDKRKSADYSINIYMMDNAENINSNSNMYRIINIVQTIGKIYEIKESIIDNIIDRIRGDYEPSLYINNKSNIEEYSDNLKEFKDYLQKEFESIYVSVVSGKNNSSIDYQNILKLARRI